jgi:ABC-type transport system involved in cytochrome c biogenesis permease subunit
MSSSILRILTVILAFAAAAGFGWGIGIVARQTQQLSTVYGPGFVMIVAMMTLLVLISIARMPLSQHAAHRLRR